MSHFNFANPVNKKNKHQKIRYWVMLVVLFILLVFLFFLKFTHRDHKKYLKEVSELPQDSRNNYSSRLNKKIYFKGVSLTKLKFVGYLFFARKKFIFLKAGKHFEKLEVGDFISDRLTKIFQIYPKKIIVKRNKRKTMIPYVFNYHRSAEL